MIIEGKAELFLWDRDEGYFVREASVVAKVVRRKDAKFSFFLTASSQGGQVLAHRVSSQMMQRWSPTTWSLTWNNVNDNGNQSSWCLRFESQESYEDFQTEFTKSAWESLNQSPWEKVKVCDANIRDWQTHVLFRRQTSGRMYSMPTSRTSKWQSKPTKTRRKRSSMSLAVSAATRTITPTYMSYSKTRTRKTKRKNRAASLHPDPRKEAGIRNSLLGTRVTGHTSFVEIRLASSGINRTRSNMSRPSPISRI